jgi:hypothetical protein
MMTEEPWWLENHDDWRTMMTEEPWWLKNHDDWRTMMTGESIKFSRNGKLSCSLFMLFKENHSQLIITLCFNVACQEIAKNWKSHSVCIDQNRITFASQNIPTYGMELN